LSLLAHDLVMQSLNEERINSVKSMFVGVLVTAIGICFFWLFANSFHVTETSWIGGLPGLIHALTVMEVALVPLLVYMLMDGIAHIARASRIEYLAQILTRCQQTTKGVPSCVLNKETYSQVLKWTPFWEGLAGPTRKDDDLKSLHEEITAVTQELERWTEKNDSDHDGGLLLLLRDTATRLQTESKKTNMEGYCEFVYFWLNGIAFYGYLLGILCYYTDENDQSVLHSLKLGMSHDAADWHGNFAGDLMWTIEPLVVLGSPTLIQTLTGNTTTTTKTKKKEEDKAKSD